MPIARVVAALGLSTAFLAAQIRPTAGQIEPGARLWQTWVLASSSELRPGPPPDRADSVRELLAVRDAAANPAASAAQQLAYWNAGSPNYRWQQIAMANTGITSFPGFRTLALMNVAIADAEVAACDAKYYYNRPRPSQADRKLATRIPTPDSPSYPSEHATAAGAAAAVNTMMPDLWRRVEDLYQAALDQPADIRHAFLRDACQGDQDLHREVLSLLDAATTNVAFLEEPAVPAGRGRLPFGVQLGPYLVEALIGTGGMGEVFRATDYRLRRAVAIKVLPAEKFSDPEHKRRFLQEARIVSALNHPNIVVLYDISTYRGIDFLVLEYVQGKTLQELIVPTGLPFEEVAQYGIQAARALAAAHRAGVVHRDIKPANIKITPESQVKILDFGVSKLADAAAVSVRGDRPGNTETQMPDTMPGVILGTVALMSPEQTRGEALDGRSDVFSLGSVLYLAATGRPPFSGASALSTMHAIATFNPPAPSTLRTDLPPAFDVIIDRALAKHKDQRYDSAGEFAEAIEAMHGNARFPFPRSVEPAPPPLVGREPELRRLDELVTQTVHGSGKFVLVSGESGIGKSALARSFLHSSQRQHPDLLVGRGACVEQYGTGEAYLPFLQALPGLLAGPGRERAVVLLRRHAPTWCLQFPSVFSGSPVMSWINSSAKPSAPRKSACCASWAMPWRRSPRHFQSYCYWRICIGRTPPAST